MASLGAKGLITKEMQWQNNMTELNHLGKALMLKPTALMGTMDQIFSSKNYYSDNSLLTNILGNNSEEVIDDLKWSWELKGATTRPAVLLEDIEPTNSTKGKFKSTFKIKLDELFYLPGDVIFPGSANKKYQVRIMEKGLRNGEGYEYVVRMNSDAASDFMPAKYFLPGTQWSKLFANYEEASYQGGSAQFSTPIALENKMSKYKKEYKITDFASEAVLAVGIPDSKTGKIHKSWMKYVEVEFWKQWYNELELAAWYSRSTDTVLGANGRPVQSGPGIQEQLEDAQSLRTSHITAKGIEEFLFDIFYSRVTPGAGRKIKGFTGEYGMLMFHRAIDKLNAANGSAFISKVDTSFQESASSPYHSNALSFGYQFTKYKMANGIEIELVHNPIYDNREINSEIDPITGFPLESQRITFLDFEGEGKAANVKLMKKKGSDTFIYVEGGFGPYGPNAGGKSVAHSGDYYSMSVGTTRGVHIKDISKCGEIEIVRN